MKFFIFLSMATAICTSCTSNSGPVSDNTDTTSADSSYSDTTAAAAMMDNNFLLIPGEKAGQTKIGDDPEDVVKRLGKPDTSDAAMGKAWLTWYGSGNPKSELNIFTSYRDTSMTGKAVKEIRVTSSSFKTLDGIGSGTKLCAIKDAYPQLKKAASYQSSSNPSSKLDVYDEIAMGIAFQVERSSYENICNAVIIHQKGTSVTEVYIPVNPDMKKID